MEWTGCFYLRCQRVILAGKFRLKETAPLIFQLTARELSKWQCVKMFTQSLRVSQWRSGGSDLAFWWPPTDWHSSSRRLSLPFFTSREKHRTAVVVTPSLATVVVFSLSLPLSLQLSMGKSKRDANQFWRTYCLAKQSASRQRGMYGLKIKYNNVTFWTKFEYQVNLDDSQPYH